MKLKGGGRNDVLLYFIRFMANVERFDSFLRGIKIHVNWVKLSPPFS